MPHPISSLADTAGATLPGPYAPKRINSRSVRLNSRDATGAAEARSRARNSRALRARRISGVPTATSPAMLRIDSSRTS